MFFSVLCLLCLYARLFICALCLPAGKGLASWLSFVVYNCEHFFFVFFWGGGYFKGLGSNQNLCPILFLIYAIRYVKLI